MDVKVKLPNRECPNEEHPAGNRFMEHVGTRRQTDEAGGTAEAIEPIAMFQCVKCRRVIAESFDPENPPGEEPTDAPPATS